MHTQQIIGLDLGGSYIRGALVDKEIFSDIAAARTNSSTSLEEVLESLFRITDKLIQKSVKAIGIGVPGLVDIEQGIVYDVVNIPSWKEVPLKKCMEERYNIPVLINNDANCFTLGEFYFGKGKEHNSMIGLTIGTGLGAGIIINKKLYAGANCGGGEFGMADYLDQCYEYYASGQFFQNVYHTSGEDIVTNATKGDVAAITMYEEMGIHLGNAIKMILYAYDVEFIILGGSVRHAWQYFSGNMWQQIHTFAFTKPKERLQIEVSQLHNSGILGAAALHYDSSDK